MKKAYSAVVVALLAVASTSAHAMTYYLVSQWWENGNQMCKYENGTVLNMGAKVCPLSIRD